MEGQRIGIDTGGTFTDFVWLDENGRFRIHKQLSTPSRPAQAVLDGVASLRAPATAAVIHGSTVATNALLEQRGARTALITTQGFRDVLAIGRQNRPDLYALVPQKAPPLVPRRWRFEVTERVSAQGEVVTPFDPAALAPILAQIEADGIESVAVCLLFSFLHPAHEQTIRRALKETYPDLPVSLSSEILPEYREYERTATTVINAYVAPLMARYLRQLARDLAPRPLSIMQSNGGLLSADVAGAEAARTVLSGPAGGVVGARAVAAAVDLEEIITFDMGGTSSDVALCPGRLPLTTEGEIAGAPLRLPMIDIHTVGAGGGSLAYVDAGGALRVGPESAGADPGPSAYGRVPPNWERRVGGVTLPMPVTVSDANLVLGRLDPTRFLGGEMALDADAARRALEWLAEQMDAASPQTAALGVIEVANAHTARAIRRISVERGFDPRRFTLVAFGGAGPLHAPDLAAQLEIPQVLLPAAPGVLSALGMATAVPMRDYAQSIRGKLEYGMRNGEWDASVFHRLRETALREMKAEGYEEKGLRLEYKVDVRYEGQSHELTVPWPDFPAHPAQVVNRFHAAHEQRYGYARLEAPLEWVTARVTAVAPAPPLSLPTYPPAETPLSAAQVGEKPVWFGEGPVTTPLYQRERLGPGHRFPGPAVIFQYDTTTVAPPGWETAVDQYRNLRLTRST